MSVLGFANYYVCVLRSLISLAPTARKTDNSADECADTISFVNEVLAHTGVIGEYVQIMLQVNLATLVSRGGTMPTAHDIRRSERARNCPLNHPPGATPKRPCPGIFLYSIVPSPRSFLVIHQSPIGQRRHWFAYFVWLSQPYVCFPRQLVKFIHNIMTKKRGSDIKRVSICVDLPCSKCNGLKKIVNRARIGRERLSPKSHSHFSSGFLPKLHGVQLPLIFLDSWVDSQVVVVCYSQSLQTWHAAGSTYEPKVVSRCAYCIARK